jgi:hypothetical protein
MGAAEETIWELSGLHRRLREIVTTTPKELLDQVPTPDANSIAILVTHLVGSEGEWLNRAAGRSIERDRDSEFRVRGRDARELIAAIEEADRAAPDLIRAAFAAGIETQRDRPGAQPVTVSFCCGARRRTCRPRGPHQTASALAQGFQIHVIEVGRFASS